MPEIKSKHIPVHIDRATYKQLKSYSEKTRQPITTIVAEACGDWLTTIGAARLEASKQGRAKLLSMVANKLPEPTQPTA